MNGTHTFDIERLRRVLYAVMLIGMGGLVTELLLLGHFESTPQFVPLIGLALGVPAVATALARPGRTTILALRMIMSAFVIAGVAGLYFHIRGNVEFELEMYPTMHGWKLVWEAMRGATPALAPGSMIQLGLIGLALTWRHPALSNRSP